MVLKKGALTSEEKSQISDLHEKGYSVEEIASQLNRSTNIILSKLLESPNYRDRTTSTRTGRVVKKVVYNNDSDDEDNEDNEDNESGYTSSGRMSGAEGVEHQLIDGNSAPSPSQIASMVATIHSAGVPQNIDPTFMNTYIQTAYAIYIANYNNAIQNNYDSVSANNHGLANVDYYFKAYMAQQNQMLNENSSVVVEENQHPGEVKVQESSSQQDKAEHNIVVSADPQNHQENPQISTVSLPTGQEAELAEPVNIPTSKDTHLSSNVSNIIQEENQVGSQESKQDVKDVEQNIRG